MPPSQTGTSQSVGRRRSAAPRPRGRFGVGTVSSRRGFATTFFVLKLHPGSVVVSVLMFMTGAWFAYEYVLPYGYAFMIEYSQKRGVLIKPELGNYYKGTTRILIAFGAVFQFPLLVAFMAKAGMVTQRTLLRYWRPAVLIIFIMAAFLTPPEPMTQIMMAGPMVLLFFVSVGVAWVINPEKPEASEEDDSGDPKAGGATAPG